MEKVKVNNGAGGIDVVKNFLKRIENEYDYLELSIKIVIEKRW